MKVCLIVGLTALVSVAQGQVAPQTAKAISKAVKPGRPGQRPEPPTDSRIFRESGRTTTPRRWSGPRNWRGVPL